MSRFSTPICLLTLWCWAALLSPTAAQETALPQEMSQAFERFIDITEALEPVLAGVTDKATADAAAPKLHEQLDAVYRSREALQSIPSLSAEQSALVQKQYARRMREGWAQVYAHIFRIQKAQCYHSESFTKEFGNLNMMLAQ
ncbi:MAG: hypothetical protein MJ051_00430 [Akkermansia sp.]|nr:hypothetical protein [Akkermansia sp.]